MLYDFLFVLIFDAFAKFFTSFFRFDIFSGLKAKLSLNLPKIQHGFMEGRSTEQAVLGVRAVIEKAIDQRKALMLMFVDIRKANDTLPVKAVINGLKELGCSWNLVHSLRSLIDIPLRTSYGGKDCFNMQRELDRAQRRDHSK